MSYPIHSVTRYDRRTRRQIATVASGLTMDAASNLATVLRHQEADETTGYRIGTLPLVEQAQALTAPLAAGETAPIHLTAA